jgi:acyl carrier protein
MTNKELVIKEVADFFKKSEDEINEDMDFFDDLGADSLDSIELVLEIEKRVDIELTDEDIDSIRTVKDLIQLVEDYA